MRKQIYLATYFELNLIFVYTDYVLICLIPEYQNQVMDLKLTADPLNNGCLSEFSMVSS